MAKSKSKAPKAKPLRHAHDYGRWYSATAVTETQTIETEWGEAVAEPGTFILTDNADPTFQIIVTQDDLDSVWTTDPVPPPSEPGPVLMGDATSHPGPCNLPGAEHHGS